jgi:hypothetical protein
MNVETFKPKNELERQLLDAQEGKISGEAFMRQLLMLQVFMPVEDKQGIGGLQTSSRAKPLIVKGEDGTDMLVLFTSPERAKDFVRQHPAYQGGLLTELSWILGRMGSGYGIALNPGWPVGMDLDRATVQQLALLARNEPLADGGNDSGSFVR